MATVKFKYLNHRGETALRTVDVDSVEFIGFSSFGYQPGWFISGICKDKDLRRSFALSRIVFEDDFSDIKRPILSLKL